METHSLKRELTEMEEECWFSSFSFSFLFFLLNTSAISSIGKWESWATSNAVAREGVFPWIADV